MKLLVLVLMLSALTPLTMMEVVASFKKCPQFFIENPQRDKLVIPTYSKTKKSYRLICQFWQNKYQYATLYDIINRISVFSAYSLNIIKDTTRPRNIWKNEPQLESRPEFRKIKEMMELSEEQIDLCDNQAVDKDYRGSDYTRGHVFPNLFSVSEDQAKSTFAFTNVAPQTQTSNEQWAVQVEEPMHEQIKNNCSVSSSYPAYIVTGVVPGNNWIKITRRNMTFEKGVNIPIYYWTAYCCFSKTGVRISNAYLAQQNTESKMTRSKLQRTVSKLNEELGNLYKIKPFQVFGTIC